MGQAEGERGVKVSDCSNDADVDRSRDEGLWRRVIVIGVGLSTYDEGIPTTATTCKD